MEELVDVPCGSSLDPLHHRRKAEVVAVAIVKHVKNHVKVVGHHDGDINTDFQSVIVNRMFQGDCSRPWWKNTSVHRREGKEERAVASDQMRQVPSVPAFQGCRAFHRDDNPSVSSPNQIFYIGEIYCWSSESFPEHQHRQECLCHTSLPRTLCTRATPAAFALVWHRHSCVCSRDSRSVSSTAHPLSPHSTLESPPHVD